MCVHFNSCLLKVCMFVQFHVLVQDYVNICVHACIYSVCVCVCFCVCVCVCEGERDRER